MVKKPTITETIRLNRLHWFGHVQRMEENRIPKKSIIQWKPLIMTTSGPALFGNNNRLITLSGGYKIFHYLTQFIVTFYTYKKQQNLFKKLM